jgi:hypothetical protein
LRSLLALLILAAALAVGACNSDGGGSPSPTLNPVPTQVTSPDVSPDMSPETSPAASPSA